MDVTQIVSIVTTIIAKLYKFVDLLALNIGQAKSKGDE